jgi:hypothetical protein
MSELTQAEKAAAAFEGLLGDRWCVRCLLCLSVAYVTTDPRRLVGAKTDWKCSLCKGDIEMMGKVVWERLEETTQVSVCDARCTNARGPLCACPCGGANHGTKRTVSVTHDHGEAPEVNMPPSEEALRIVGEFIVARDRVASIAKQLKDAVNKGIYLGGYGSGLFRLMRSAEDAVRKANDARSHQSRMTALHAIITMQAKLIAQAKSTTVAA